MVFKLNDFYDFWTIYLTIFLFLSVIPLLPPSTFTTLLRPVVLYLHNTHILCTIHITFTT